ncbi:hypothetical protein TNCV_3575171 [Trichonephila clavipes]|nr:hypothetical protein TNCV_3575171 [Trichonephila clavipes]
MKDSDEENFNDSNSKYEDEFENSIFEDTNEVDLDASANFDEIVESFFFMEEDKRLGSDQCIAIFRFRYLKACSFASFIHTSLLGFG